VYEPVVDSTNRLARELALAGAEHGTTVIADYQECGRGRLGRSWMAPFATGILLSVILRVPEGVAPPMLTVIGALSAQDALLDATGVDAQLKWPNDVLVRGRKICGVLGETSGPDTAVLGIGANVNVEEDAPAFPSATATSVQLELGRPVVREPLIHTLFKHLSLWYRDLTERPSDVWAAWCERLDIVGRRVDVIEDSGRWSGTAIGIEPDGGLRIRSDIGTVRTVYAADVSLRHVTGFTTA
jgi:BirA family biotin operon repressor/biotin-[acetyl-CoA-carboxylase] ligase